MSVTTLPDLSRLLAEGTVEVTRADREAAAEMWRAAHPEGETADWQAAWMGKGTADCGPVVQSFARHRLATAQENERLREALEQIGKFVDDYYAPWGAWKTAWWEGEVSDDAAFSEGNALKHVANIARSALQPQAHEASK